LGLRVSGLVSKAKVIRQVPIEKKSFFLISGNLDQNILEPKKSVGKIRSMVDLNHQPKAMILPSRIPFLTDGFARREISVTIESVYAAVTILSGKARRSKNRMKGQKVITVPNTIGDTLMIFLFAMITPAINRPQ